MSENMLAARMDKGFRITCVSKKKLTTGLILIVTALYMPLQFNIVFFHIQEQLINVLRSRDQLEMLEAALSLVCMNTIRTIPSYVGTFFTIDSLDFYWNKRKLTLLNSILLVIILRFIYYIIELIHHIHYDFGVPAVLMLLILMIYDKLDYRYLNSIKKFLMIVFVLTAFQFLDVTPALSTWLFGRGETSQDIKTVANLIGMDDFLNAATITLFLIFLLFGLLIFFLLRDENHLRELNVLRDKNQAMMIENRLKAMQNRSYAEMQHLVHDLKSPLTSIQTLTGVLKMCKNTSEEVDMQDILEHIERSVERMSSMISEILFSDSRQQLTTEELLSAILAQASVSDYASSIDTVNDVPEALISVNRILLTRAFINLLDNAYYARAEDRDLHIRILVEKVDSSDRLIRFCIQDNGLGISEEALAKIWENDYSTRNSSGLGLPFVREVVEKHGGEIEAESCLDQGTVFMILLPEVGKDE